MPLESPCCLGGPFFFFCAGLGQKSTEQEDKMQKQLELRMGMAVFLQDTVRGRGVAPNPNPQSVYCGATM